MRTTATAPAAPRAGKRRWRRVFIPLLLIGAVGGAVVYLFREDVQDAWALSRFRRAAAASDPSLPEHRDRLRERLFRTEDNLDQAVPLAADPDSKVRAAVVGLLLADQPKVRKQDAVEGLHAAVRMAAWRTRVGEAVERLLQDPDPVVRHTALRAVSELDWADQFRTQLTDAMENGSPADRLVVAEYVAHWNGPLLAEVVGDANQAADVRITAMRGLDTYGDRGVASNRGELREALEAALRSPDPDVQKAAIPALRYAQRGPDVWLDVLCEDRRRDLHSLAFRAWIDSLGRGSAMTWSDSHDAWYRSTSIAVRCGVATHALCEGAKLQILALETEPAIPEGAAIADRDGPAGRAFNTQLARLGNVLSIASAARWYCNTFEKPPELVGRLPHETPAGSAPPRRAMKAYLFREAKPVWEWCLSRKDGYPTRFLTTNTIVRNYGHRPAPDPIPVRPLGAVMDDLLVGPSEFDKLRSEYDGR